MEYLPVQEILHNSKGPYIARGVQTAVALPCHCPPCALIDPAGRMVRRFEVVHVEARRDMTAGASDHGVGAHLSMR